MMIMRFFLIFLYKGICCGYSFELHRQVDAIQMSTNNICLYKEVDKQYTSCNPKSTELLDCALIGVCAVIRSNTVFKHENRRYSENEGLGVGLLFSSGSALSCVRSSSESGEESVATSVKLS